GRRAGAPDAASVRAPAGVRRQPRQADDPPDAAARGVGPRLRRRLEPPARERLAAAAQDRGRPSASALPPHRAGRRLPAGGTGFEGVVSVIQGTLRFVVNTPAMTFRSVAARVAVLGVLVGLIGASAVGTGTASAARSSDVTGAVVNIYTQL